MNRLSLTTLATLVAAGTGAMAQTAPIQSPIAISTPDFTARVGGLAQFQLQSNTDPVLTGTSDNFVLRRIRLITGGTVGDSIDWLVDTDDANQGKVASNTNGTKNENNLYIQDAVLTIKFDPAFKLDTGLLVIDPSHDGTVGAPKLYAWDSFSYQGLENAALQNSNSGTQGSAPLNRELGLQARGLVLGGHLEYHLALTNGYRNGANDGNGGNGGNTFATGTVTPGVTSISSNNAFRVTARAQINLFDNEGAGYTEAGTYFGARKIVSFSLGYDGQQSYTQKVGEFIVDLPVNGGADVFSAQGTYWIYDGGSLFPTLLKQKDYSLQAGYNFGKRWNPIVRIESKSLDTPGYASEGTPVKAASWTVTPSAFDESRQSLGLAYWFHENNANFKVFYTNVQPKNLVSAKGVDSGYKSYHQIVAQFQVYAF